MLLGRARLERGAEEEALAAVEPHAGDFAVAGIAARIRLTRADIGADAFAALDRGERDAALDALLEALAGYRDGSSGDGADAGEGGIKPNEARELLRQAIVGILSELDPADPSARECRRKLATALG